MAGCLASFVIHLSFFARLAAAVRYLA